MVTYGATMMDLASCIPSLHTLRLLTYYYQNRSPEIVSCPKIAQAMAQAFMALFATQTLSELVKRGSGIQILAIKPNDFDKGLAPEQHSCYTRSRIVDFWSREQTTCPPYFGPVSELPRSEILTYDDDSEFSGKGSTVARQG